MIQINFIFYFLNQYTHMRVKTNIIVNKEGNKGLKSDERKLCIARKPIIPLKKVVGKNCQNR